MWRPQSRYTVSRIECRIKFPENQRCRAKIALHTPKSRSRTFLRTPLSHFPLIRSRQGVRRAGGGYRGSFGFRKRIALQGGIAATVIPVALHCATKRGNESIYLHRSGPLLENCLDRPENRYGRYGFCWVFQHFHIYRRGGWSQSFPLKIFFSCSLGGGGRYFSVPCKGPSRTVFRTESDSVVFYYSVVEFTTHSDSLPKYSKSLQNAVIHHIFSSESLRVVN